jgi:hypothetical protein
MTISETTRTLLDHLSKFSGLRLKNLQDLALLIELSHGREKILDDASFTAKYLNGLGRVLQKGIPPPPPVDGDKAKTIEPDAMLKIRNEYKQNLKKLSEQLKDLTSKLERKEKDRFHSRFLSPTRESIGNLTNLIYDLSWLKIYKNKLKRTGL